MRTMILLNGMGHIEVSWTPENDELVKETIRKKMEQGIKFFIIKPLFGKVMPRRMKIRTVNQLKEHKVEVDDKDIEDLFLKGTVEFTRRDSDRIETVRRAKTPEEVMENDTIGVRQQYGG